ncbi:acyltransferase family protein, partial [Rodentibacter pneumotropicus]
MDNRISSLDYLRGLCSFSIMIYHYMLWTGYKVDANDFISRMGIYGVSIFYILSGLTLYI